MPDRTAEYSWFGIPTCWFNWFNTNLGNQNLFLVLYFISGLTVIHTHTYANTHTHHTHTIPTHTHTIPTNTHTTHHALTVRTHTYTHAQNVYQHTYTHAHDTHIRTHTYKHPHTNIRKHTHTSTNKHTHIQRRGLLPDISLPLSNWVSVKCVYLICTLLFTLQTMSTVIVNKLSKLNDAIDAIQVSGSYIYTCVCFLQSVIHSRYDSQRNQCGLASISIVLDEKQSKRWWTALMVCCICVSFIWFVSYCVCVMCYRNSHALIFVADKHFYKVVELTLSVFRV